MPLPPSVYLQSSSGDSIGPLPTQWLELLFHAGVIDHGTPISLNGTRWRAIGDWGEMSARLHEVEREVRAGQNPWPLMLPRDPSAASSPGFALPSADLPPVTPDVPAASTPGTGDLATSPTTPRTFDGPPLAAWTRLAADRATGEISIDRPAGRVSLSLRAGVVARVDTEDPELTLPKRLVARGLLDHAALTAAAARAGDFGGDLGAALVATGAIAPDRFFEAYVDWATEVLAAFTLAPAQRIELGPSDVPPPPVPLGLSRLGAMMRAIRTIDRSELSARLLPHRTRPLILSQVEGARIEDLELRPRELRTLNQVNGARTLGKILEELGTDEEMRATVVRVLFFATESGFVVMGEDPHLKHELAEAAELQKELAKIEGWNFFDVLGVSRTASDDEVRTSYTELAKKYHPDRLRAEVTPVLLELRQKMFGLVSDAFAALESESRRKRYVEELDRGQSSQDLIKAQNALQAETCFKKAEVLMRVRKYDEALEQIDLARELNPEDLEFAVFRRYLEYLLASRSRNPAELAPETLEAIKEASRSQPNLLSAQLFSAQLYKAMGDTKQMARAYKKVLEIDPQNTEAKQELRLEKLRREKEKDTKKKGWFGG